MISVVRALVCAVLYGVMENRLFFEQHEDPWLFKHFKTYHLFMLTLFAVIAFDTNWLLFAWSLIAMPFIQDMTWQLCERRKLQRDDWSNFGHLPLIKGLYVWYILSLVVLIALGLTIWYLSLPPPIEPKWLEVNA